MTYTEPRPGGYGPPPTGHYPPPIPSERFDVGVDYQMNPFPLPDPDSLEGRWDLEGDLARLLQTTSAGPHVPPPVAASVPTSVPVEDPVHSTGPIPIRPPSPPPPMGAGAASAAGSASGCRRCRGSR